MSDVTKMVHKETSAVTVRQLSQERQFWEHSGVHLRNSSNRESPGGPVISGLPQWLSSEESACSVGSAGDTGSISGSGRSLGGGHAIHSRILAWRIPRTEKPGRLQSVGLQRAGHDWSDLTLLPAPVIRTLCFHCRVHKFKAWSRN